MMIIIIKTLQTLAGVKVSASAAWVRFGLARKRGARGQSPGHPPVLYNTCFSFVSLPGISFPSTPPNILQGVWEEAQEEAGKGFPEVSLSRPRAALSSGCSVVRRLPLPLMGKCGYITPYLRSVQDASLSLGVSHLSVEDASSTQVTLSVRP